MQGYYLLANAQADSRTTCLGREKRHEDAIQHLWQDAFAIVGDGNDEVAFVV